MKLRVVQYWGKHPETEERVDLRYTLQQWDDDRWVDIPVADVEVVLENRKDENQGH